MLNQSATAEFIARKADDDPRAAPTSTEFDPYYVSVPFFYHQTSPGGGRRPRVPRIRA
ncbi:MAG: hypothetical protein M3069_23525 [Chloroflexota bacterium]|nr:hypothetical protein [Chloroflexota bacterium]